MCITMYKANIVKYENSQICSGLFKNRKSNNMPTGKGINTINHIGALNASVIAPNETTKIPMIRACQIVMPLVMKRLPKKYDRPVNRIATIKLMI